MPNRLINSTSPYLLQHAHNPVEWHPWDAEAIALARTQDKPIFLSIGYAACHWCHVMERECFERPEIAAVMNKNFINIKVDREERPDLDDLYMLATQVMSGSGGWPMSVWLTPKLEPFYAGTYFPPTDGYGRPGFPRLLLALADTWQNRRGTLIEQSAKVVDAIKLHVDESDTKTPLETRNLKPDTRQWVRLAIEQAADRFDDVNGGPTGAPKFPPHQMLAFWTALLSDPDNDILSSAERGILAGKLSKTLQGMARGGIYDHVGGAFARYSTDEYWLVPHFEKMLYDSAQLAPIYAQASLILDNPDFARIARETLDFFLREMRSPEGAFYSSLDADSEGEEGKYYVWTIPEIQSALSADEAATIIAYFGMTPAGNWHETPTPGASVLAVAEGQTFTPAIGAALEKLRLARQARTRPGLDDKILTSWNGLMLSALAITGRALNEPTYITAAEQLANFLLTRHATPDHRLLRTSRNGPAHTEGFLDDYAFLASGLTDFADAVEGPTRQNAIASCQSLIQSLTQQFADPRGGFYFTGPQHETLFARMKNAADNATPSPNGIAIRALLRLAHHTSNAGYRESAIQSIQAFHTNIARRPEYFSTILRALVEDHQAGTAKETPLHAALADSPSSILQLTFDRIPTPPLTRGTPFDILLRLTITPGYHIQPAAPTEPNTILTTAKLRPLDENIALTQKWHFPPTNNPTPGYSGTIPLRVECTLPPSTPSPLKLRAIITAQPCTQTACLAPQTITTDFTITFG